MRAIVEGQTSRADDVAHEHPLRTVTASFAVAFCGTENIGTPNLSYAAQYLACALPYERFTSALASSRASLGAGVVRYSFTVTDLHRLLSPVSRRTRPHMALLRPPGWQWGESACWGRPAAPVDWSRVCS
jgi:hypothetical protein